MGFSDVKSLAVELLRDGNYLFDPETSTVERNDLQAGNVTLEFVIELINRCRGNQYETTAHHFNDSITVHILKPNHQRIQWYVKFYFQTDELGQLVVFLSVHRSRHR